MKDDRHEELVEEILEDRFCEDCDAWDADKRQCLESKYADRYCRSWAKATITRVGKAYAGGMPLPGEVGRYILPGWGSGVDWAINMTHQGAKVFIALSPTGEEE